MSPLAHTKQSVLIQNVPPIQKNLFRPQANTKKPQENTRLNLATKTAMAVLSTLSASYLLYQNLPSKAPVAPPSSRINPMFWVVGTLTASALFFMSKMNTCLINHDSCLRQKENDEETSITNPQKNPKEIFKTIKKNFEITKKITEDDFKELCKIIKYLETNNTSEIDSKLALSLSYFIRWLILHSEPESHERVARLVHTAFDSFCQFHQSCCLDLAEIYAKVQNYPEILATACKKLQLKLATFYAKKENPAPFEQIIHDAWNHFHNDPNLATEFLITCANSKEELCQNYLINSLLNWGQENHSKIALACTADMTLKGNKSFAFRACEKYLIQKQYTLFLPIANKIIESFKMAKNIDGHQQLYLNILYSFHPSEEDLADDEKLIKIILAVSIISEDKKTADLILVKFPFKDLDLVEQYKKQEDQKKEINKEKELPEPIKQISS